MARGMKKKRLCQVGVLAETVTEIKLEFKVGEELFKHLVKRILWRFLNVFVNNDNYR